MIQLKDSLVFIKVWWLGANRMKNKKIPVLMYHSIGPRDTSHRVFDLLRTPINIFVSHLKHLKAKGFSTIFLIDLYNHIKFNVNLPPKPIILTFDEGYLDSWVYVYPLLKKYGFRGTIFVSTDFIDPIRKYRPNLDDVWEGKLSENELIDKGFLSFREMKEMEDNGVIDIQSHSKTHTCYFASDKIVDFHHPGDFKNNSYEYLAHNKYPERKYKYLNENQEVFIEYGTPIYQLRGSLSHRRYFSDEYLDKHITTIVKDSGGKKFFNKNNWKSQLFSHVEHYKNNHELKDRYESEEEYKKRVEHELLFSKNILEQKLKKNIHFLCWPRGETSEYAIKKAYDVGYLATTKPSKVNYSTTEFNNLANIERMGASTFLVGDNEKIYGIRYGGGFTLLEQISIYKSLSKLDFFHRAILASIRVLLKTYFLINKNEQPYHFRK